MLKMLEEYRKRVGVISALEERLEVEQKAQSNLVKRIKDAHGAGPFTLDNKTLFIYNRGDTWFFSGQRGRGKKGLKTSALAGLNDLIKHDFNVLIELIKDRRSYSEDVRSG